MAPETPEGGDWIRRTFASLAKPNFRLFYIGHGISLLGTWMGQAAEQWLVFDLTRSNEQLGIVAAAGILPLVFSPIGGGLADRFSKRRILYATTLLNFAVAMITAVLVWLGVIEVWMIALLALLGGVVFAVENPVRQAFLFEMVGRENLLNAVALTTALFNVTRMIGQGTAGIVMYGIGVTSCFFVDAVSFLAVAMCLVFMRFASVAAPASSWKGLGPFLLSLKDGFGYVRRDRAILTLAALLAISMLFGLPYASQMAAFAREELGVEELGFGSLLFVNGLGALVGALWLAGQGASLDRRRVAFRMQMLFGASLLALGFAPGVPVALPFMLLAGFGMVTFFSAANAFIQAAVPDELRGRVLGVWHCVFGGALPLGQILMGLAAGAIGVRASIAAGGAICLACALLLLAAASRRPRAACAGDM